jgi:hypothetical protein
MADTGIFNPLSSQPNGTPRCTTRSIPWQAANAPIRFPRSGPSTETRSTGNLRRCPERDLGH